MSHFYSVLSSFIIFILCDSFWESSQLILPFLGLIWICCTFWELIFLACCWNPILSWFCIFGFPELFCWFLLSLIKTPVLLRFLVSRKGFKFLIWLTNYIYIFLIFWIYINKLEHIFLYIYAIIIPFLINALNCFLLI